MTRRASTGFGALFIGATIADFGLVGTAFSWLEFWELRHGGAALGNEFWVMLVGPLVAPVFVAAFLYAIMRGRGVELRWIGLLWFGSFLAGLALWYAFCVAIFTGLRYDEAVMLGAMSAVLLLGVLLMFLAVPGRGA